MSDVGPLLRLYGVADSVLVEQGADAPEPLRRWLPANTHREIAGWYELTRQALDRHYGLDGRGLPEITGDNRVEVARSALTDLTELHTNVDKVPPRPAHVVHAVTAAARALPDDFDNVAAEAHQLLGESLAPLQSDLEGGLPAPHEVIDGLTQVDEDDLQSAFDDAVSALDDEEAAAANPAVVLHHAEWELAVTQASLTGASQLDKSPCTDSWTVAPVGGTTAPAVVLRTEYDLPNGTTLANVCGNFFDPSTWPTCAGGTWTEMAPCHADGAEQSYIETVTVDGQAITTCLTFKKTDDYDGKGGCRLSFRMCNEGAGAGCIQEGASDGFVTVDHGYLVASDNGDGTVHLVTQKTVRFTPPIDGMAGAMLACAIGYGAAGHAMAVDCSK